MLGATPAASAAQERRRENLALVFQELFTVIERLRSNRQTVNDANSFRHQIREALKAADVEGRKRGYAAEEIQLGVFAMVAFLDESILNLRSPVFADWPRQPMQEELFGHHVAGEVFFQNVQKLLGQTDTQVLADVLEIYYICLLLGFAGRYSVGGRGELRGTLDAIAAKINRIRGGIGDLSPSWAIPPGAPRISAGDPHLRKFLFGAIGTFLLCLALFLTFRIVLRPPVSELQSIATQGRG
jgi:type VI secretion system protein ImpK